MAAIANLSHLQQGRSSSQDNNVEQMQLELSTDGLASSKSQFADTLRITRRMSIRSRAAAYITLRMLDCILAIRLRNTLSSLSLLGIRNAVNAEHNYDSRSVNKATRRKPLDLRLDAHRVSRFLGCARYATVSWTSHLRTMNKEYQTFWLSFTLLV